MKSITVRDIPDDVRNALAARAAARGQPMQEFLRLELTELAHRADAKALMARARDLKQRTGSTVTAAAILDARDADRR